MPSLRVLLIAAAALVCVTAPGLLRCDQPPSASPRLMVPYEAGRTCSPYADFFAQNPDLLPPFEYGYDATVDRYDSAVFLCRDDRTRQRVVIGLSKGGLTKGDPQFACGALVLDRGPFQSGAGREIREVPITGLRIFREPLRLTGFVRFEDGRPAGADGTHMAYRGIDVFNAVSHYIFYCHGGEWLYLPSAVPPGG